MSRQADPYLYLQALKHHTSKLTTFSDLAQVSTLGFRGEALSSLCGTAELSLVTATALTTPAASSLTFETSGKCVVGGKAARSRGTTVTVKELFKHLPVRRKELIKNGKREFGKALELIQSYALLKTGCRIEVKNSVKGFVVLFHLLVSQLISVLWSTPQKVDDSPANTSLELTAIKLFCLIFLQIPSSSDGVGSRTGCRSGQECLEVVRFRLCRVCQPLSDSVRTHIDLIYVTTTDQPKYSSKVLSQNLLQAVVAHPAIGNSIMLMVDPSTQQRFDIFFALRLYILFSVPFGEISYLFLT